MDGTERGDEFFDFAFIQQFVPMNRHPAFLF